MAEQAVPGLEKGEPALGPGDLQAQEVLELGGEDGQRSSSSKAAEKGVGEVHGDETYLEQAHQHLRESDTGKVLIPKYKQNKWSQSTVFIPKFRNKTLVSTYLVNSSSEGECSSYCDCIAASVTVHPHAGVPLARLARLARQWDTAVVTQGAAFC